MENMGQFDERIARMLSILPENVRKSYEKFVVEAIRKDPARIVQFEAWAENERMKSIIGRKQGLPLGGKAFGLDSQKNQYYFPWQQNAREGSYDQYMNFMESMQQDQQARVDGMFSLRR